MSKMEILMGVLGVIVGVGATIFAKFGKRFEEMAEKTPTKIDDVILKYARLGVDYADNYFNGSSNETKKKMATLETLKQLAENGIKQVPTNELGQAIETVVKEKKEKEVEEKK